ncbi:aldehyde ferredoxin oxidoreductase N-terminal domain-containing protein [Chloroflexota bacterium]
MRYAETGVNLEIDLTRGSVEKEATDPRLTELHLGGLGTNVKIMWDRVPPEIEPFSPDNLLIFGTGLLVGTPATGANRTIVSTLSPQTQLMTYSMMGGFLAQEFKYAGYDKVIIRGKSPEWVYLWINNDKIEIRDASHLQGKGTYETIELIHQELKEPKAQVAAIGLAGENKVNFASIEHRMSSAGRAGIGAVMGDKRLKAIAVRGTGDVNICRPAEYFKLCDDLRKSIPVLANNTPKGVGTWMGTFGEGEMEKHDESFHTDNFSWGNARTRRKGFWNKEIEKKWWKVQDRMVERYIGCYNCPFRCQGIITHEKLQRYVMKCFAKLTYLMAAMTEDNNFSFRIAGIAQEYGMDAFAAPQVMAFAIELYEAGILTDQDMPGFPSNNEERFFWLLERIARREGIGDVLANGVYFAARQIGKGAEAYDHNTMKKLEQVPLKLGMLNPIFYLMHATGEKITITQIQGGVPPGPIFEKEFREEFIKDWPVPTDRKEEFNQFILEWGEPHTMFPYYPSIDMVCKLVDFQEAMHYIDNTTGVCSLVSSRHLKPPYHIQNFPHIISAATCLDIDEGELLKITRRNRNLLRAVNVRRGLRREDERPPEDHWKKRFPEYEKELLDGYYKFKGWNNEGIPTKQTLRDLDLDYVGDDLEQRGIYK